MSFNVKCSAVRPALALVSAAAVAMAVSFCGAASKSASSSSAPASGSVIWEAVPIDSAYDVIRDSAATYLIAGYDSLLAPLSRIVCYTDREILRGKPESPLSNFIADALMAESSVLTGHGIDASLLNIGGIRTDMPKGAVRVYDIYSILPFNNVVYVVKMKGAGLRKLIASFTGRGSVQPMGGVRFTFDGNTLKEALVGGLPIDDGRDYYLATVDFLMNGGDRIYVQDYADSFEDTGVYLRDLVVRFLDEGELKAINPVVDGRVRYLGEPDPIFMEE